MFCYANCCGCSRWGISHIKLARTGMNVGFQQVLLVRLGKPHVICDVCTAIKSNLSLKFGKWGLQLGYKWNHLIKIGVKVLTL